MSRHRPPLTAREIAAYLAGARLHRLWLSQAKLPLPDHDHYVAHLAREDAEVMCSLGARRWWTWFDRGWAEHDDWPL